MILILDEISLDLECVYDCLNTTDGISIEWIAVRDMEIAESNKNMMDFKFYKSIKMNYSLFVVSMLTSTEITCYSVAQQIAKCMYSSKLQQSCQLKEKMFGGIFKLMRFIYLQKDLDIVRLFSWIFLMNFSSTGTISIKYSNKAHSILLKQCVY